MDDLIERVQDLPPELFNKFKDLVFTHTPCTLKIDANYKPSKLLEVDKTTRDQFAKTYYGEITTFEISYAYHLREWLATLNAKHCALIRESQLRVTKPNEARSRRTPAGVQGRQHWEQELFRVLKWTLQEGGGGLSMKLKATSVSVVRPRPITSRGCFHVGQLKCDTQVNSSWCLIT
jgi:hypothetical protein